MAALKLALFARTDVGLIREHNEDSFLVAELGSGARTLTPEVCAHVVGPRGTLLVVCDGMGGAAAGEVASQLAVDVLYEQMAAAPHPDVVALALQLRSAVFEANRRIANEARENPARRGMGTTLTAAALVDQTLVIAQIGDSRCYVVREGRIGQVTRDQSLASQLIEAGEMTAEEARHFEHANVILQALGVVERIVVPISFVALRRGDRLLLCSDGLSGPLLDEELLELVGGGGSPEEIAGQLIDRAREAGGPDNITALVAVVDGDLPEPAGEAVQYRLFDLPEDGGGDTAPTRPLAVLGGTPQAAAPPTAPAEEVPASAPTDAGMSGATGAGASGATGAGASSATGAGASGATAAGAPGAGEASAPGVVSAGGSVGSPEAPAPAAAPAAVSPSPAVVSPSPASAGPLVEPAGGVAAPIGSGATGRLAVAIAPASAVAERLSIALVLMLIACSFVVGVIFYPGR